LTLLKSQREILKDLFGRCNAKYHEQSSSSRLFGLREDYSKRSTQDCFEDMLNWLWRQHLINQTLYGYCSRYVEVASISSFKIGQSTTGSFVPNLPIVP
jgi:hypothetical protein